MRLHVKERQILTTPKSFSNNLKMLSKALLWLLDEKLLPKLVLPTFSSGFGINRYKTSSVQESWVVFSAGFIQAEGLEDLHMEMVGSCS